MASASVNILVHAFWYIYACVVLGYILRSGTVLSLGMQSDGMIYTPICSVGKLWLLYILPTLDIPCHFHFSYDGGCIVGCHTVALIRLSLMTNEVVHIFICCLVIWIPSLVNYLLKTCPLVGQLFCRSPL